MPGPGPLFAPGRLGPVAVAGRLVRAGTSECMAPPGGRVTDAHVALYETLARGGVPLIITGHMYVEPRGQYERGQTGLHADDLVPDLARLVDAVHRHGARIFGQLAHAGSQSLVAGPLPPLAPSPVANVMTGRPVPGAGPEAIEAALEAFAAAAGRAVAAGFDGVHIHGANGYLISQFSSPVTNRRTDGWGGDAGGRLRFALEVVGRVRARVPADRGLTMKLGMVDAVPGGLGLEESRERARRLVAAGLDGIEVSSNLMRGYVDSAAPYVAVGPRRALADLLIHRLGRPPGPEAYFRPWARALRTAVETRIILVGGLRRRETMEDVLASGDADFVALARPFIREPDLVRRLAAGRTGPVECTSCNLCLMHDGYHALRCWRTPRRRLLQHALFRLSGGFRHGIGTRPRAPDA